MGRATYSRQFRAWLAWIWDGEREQDGVQYRGDHRCDLGFRLLVLKSTLLRLRGSDQTPRPHADSGATNRPSPGGASLAPADATAPCLWSVAPTML